MRLRPITADCCGGQRERAQGSQPSLFGEVMRKFSGTLPSDNNLRAKLQDEWGFASESAANAFMRALRDALTYGRLDETGTASESSGQNLDQGGDNMQLQNPLSPAPAPIAAQARVPHPGAPQENHTWKLAEGVWANITITGSLSQKAYDKLTKYVALIEVDESADGGDDSGH